MKLSLFFILIVFSLYSSGQNSVDSVLRSLDEIIENREYFVEKKQNKIDEIKKDIYSGINPKEPSELYKYYLDLCEQYTTFKFDSAFRYAQELIKIANTTRNQNKIAEAKIKFANILISAGIFNEMLDTLKSINLSSLSAQSKADYYATLSRGYFDMESFSQSQQFSAVYREKGMAFFDSAMYYYPSDSWEYKSIEAQKNIKLGNNDKAIEILKDLIYNYDLNNDQVAIQFMSLAFTYEILSDHEKALKYMVDASIADFKGAKKEAVALLFVANYVFERGGVIRASKYINIALEDSRFYGSNFRLWQVSQFLPFIKSKHIVTIEKQKQKLLYYLITVSILSIVVIFSFLIIFWQIQKLRKAKNLVEKINKKLAISNEELLIANKIKEEYVGYYFSVNTQMIEKLDKFKSSIGRKIRRKQFDELISELDSINIHHEKSNLYNNFDEIFLKIFPDFVSKFNDLIQESEKIQLKDGQLLNTELRIFALIRLGIHDNEKIAKILGYSVNTVYAYKSKIKTKAIVPSEDFEKEIMKIKRF